MLIVQQLQLIPNPNWVDIATLIVFTLTLGLLFWYAVETYRLRKTAQQQIETSYLPLVTLKFIGDRGTRPELRIQNIGYGPAFNIEVTPVKRLEYQVECDFVPLLRKEADERIGPRFIRDDGAMVVLTTWGEFLKLEKGVNEFDLFFYVSFENAQGKKYRSGHQVSYYRGVSDVKVTYKGLEERS